MELLELLAKDVKEKTQKLNDENFIIRGVWNLQLLFQPNTFERAFNYKIFMIQTSKQGCCYYLGQDINNKELLGLDARSVKTDNEIIKIALLDSIYSNIEYNSKIDYIIQGSSHQKAEQRANAVISEVLYYVASKGINNPTILNIGVVGLFIKKLKEIEFNVYATDLDRKIIGKKISDVVIQNGTQKNDELIEQSDIVLLTGMTLASGTMLNIINKAKEKNKILVIFAETGAWLAGAYCDLLKVNSVISEPFPFYIFDGYSQIKIYRT